MKFKEKCGNTFVFDGGYAGEELTLEQRGGTSEFFWFKDVAVNTSLRVTMDDGCINVPYRDIRTAVNLMGILVKERLV